MRKKQRRTLADVNVSIQGMAPPVPTPAAATAPPTAPEPVLEATRSRENVATSALAPAPRGFNVRKERVEKPHQSIYAHPLVFRELRKIAEADGVKPQDLYREGLREVFRRRGLDFDALDRGEEV